MGSGNSIDLPAGHDEWLRRQRKMDEDLDRIEVAQAEERRSKAAKDDCGQNEIRAAEQARNERLAKEKAEITAAAEAEF